MKIKVHVHPTKGGGASVSKKDQRMITRLFRLKKKFTIEYIYNKFMPPR
jgi:hypothetical protein